MSLLFLNSNDFYNAEGTKGSLLCVKIPQISLVFFYSNQCNHCKNLMPIFKNIPNKFTGCQFGIINIIQNKEVLYMSQGTITPIKYVPYIVLYVNNRPYMKYNGKHNEESILQFIIDMTTKLNRKQVFVSNKPKNVSKYNINKIKNSIPEYSIGVPLYGDEDKTYLDFNCNTGYVAHKTYKK